MLVQFPSSLKIYSLLSGEMIIGSKKDLNLLPHNKKDAQRESFKMLSNKLVS